MYIYMYVTTYTKKTEVNSMLITVYEYFLFYIFSVFSLYIYIHKH